MSKRPPNGRQISVAWPGGGASVTVSPLLWWSPWRGSSFMKKKKKNVYIPCFCAIDVDLIDYRWCKGTGLYDDASDWRDARGLSLSWGFIIIKESNSPHQAMQSNIFTGGESLSSSGSGWCCFAYYGGFAGMSGKALEPPCLAPEGDQLRDAGLPPDIVETILSARAPSTTRSYAFNGTFRELVYGTPCRPSSLPSCFSAGVSAREIVLRHMSWYSQSLCGRHFGLPCSHWRGFCGKAPSSCPLHSGKRLRPSTSVTAPSWDLAIVLEGLVMTPFEPLESAPIRSLTLKMFFNGHYFSYENWGFAGSVNLAILPRLCPWAGQSYFAPSPELSSESSMNPIVLEAFCPPPFTTPEQERLHLLCPVRALQIYIHRTSQWCKSEQLFICYGGRNWGGGCHEAYCIALGEGCYCPSLWGAWSSFASKS